jgi:HD-GYP domain-containing protein (c-di-GMP phosphodiesterase class II)
MSFIDLVSVAHRVTVGQPLPFHVYSSDMTLLLARGRTIENHPQLDTLLSRGALVDIAEVVTKREDIKRATPEQLPALLRSAMALACDALERVPVEHYAKVVELVAEPLLAIVETDPDLAIFQILRQEGNYLTQYGVTHSIHCAFTVFLVAARFGWSEAEIRRGFNAALTMNVSMFELQGLLATSTAAPSPAQIALIESHPLRSRRMLETAGIQDADWLLAIEQHHPVEVNGARTPVGELASLLHSADTYTAKLSPRRSREALGADVAARMMFTAHRDDPATAALVKEFGLYPPGCQVRLANGESGIVVKRGELAHIPWVAVTADAAGMLLPEPVRRNTAQTLFKVSAVLRDPQAWLQVSPEMLQRIAHA